MSRQELKFGANCCSAARLGYNLSCVSRGRKSLLGVILETAITETAKFYIFR